MPAPTSMRWARPIMLLLTGRGPYAESTTMPMVMFAHCYRPVPDPREVLPGIPEACAAIVRRAMAKDPSCRYQTAEEMLADLEAVLSGSEGRAEGGPESTPQGDPGVGVPARTRDGSGRRPSRRNARAVPVASPAPGVAIPELCARGRGGFPRESPGLAFTRIESLV